MKDFAVVCASNPKRNDGMYSVDLAAAQYFGALGRSHDLVVTQGPTSFGALRFRKIRNAREFSGYKHIVYWGDFQNNPLWGRGDYRLRERKREGISSDAEAIRGWTDRYLGLREILPTKVGISAVGGCFLGADLHLDEPDMRRLFSGFLVGANCIIPRDVASAGIVRMYGGADARVVQGFDCASQLELPGKNKDGKYFVYSFRRTIDYEQVDGLVEKIRKATGMRAVDVRWLRRKKFILPMGMQFRSMSKTLSGASFIATDIYHLAINGFARGTPVFCVGDGASGVDRTTDDRKKFILYDMLGLGHMIHDTRDADWGLRLVDGISTSRAGGFPDGVGKFPEFQQKMRAALDEVFR